MTSEEMKKPEGSSAPAPTAVETTPQLGDGCAAYAKAQCATMTKCSPHTVSLKWIDCNAALERECKLLYGAPGSLVNAAWLHKCAAWSQTATCDAFDREGGDCAPPHGQRETGTGCVANSQCASTYCKKTGRDCGTCVQKPTTSPPEPRGPLLGEKCTDSCDDRLHCDKGKCVAPKARIEGDSCTTDILGSSVGAQPCGAGLSCVGTDKPTCQKRPADGEACTANGPRCYFPAACRDGTCKLPDPAACS